MYALVRRVLYIDRPAGEPPNPFEMLTVDKVQTPNGRMISSKPPVLPLLMAGEYAALNSFADWRLTNRDDLRRVMRVMIVTLIKIPYAVGMLFFVLLLRLFFQDGKKAALVLLIMAFASPIPGYACQINNHTPSAAALCGALYFGLGLYAGKLKPSSWRFCAFGFLSAFIFVTDIPITIFPASLGLLLIMKYPRQAMLWAGLGALPLLTLHFALMTAITGSPFPVQTRKSCITQEFLLAQSIGVDGLNESRWLYLFHMNFGRFRLLLFPSLLFAVPIHRSLVNREVGIKSFALTMGAAGSSYLYYVLRQIIMAAAYGFRWHIGAVPVFLFFSAVQMATTQRKYQWAFSRPCSSCQLFGRECMQARNQS